MENVVKGFIAHMDAAGNVKCDEKEYKDIHIPTALANLAARKDPYGECYLFFHEDVPGMGCVSDRIKKSTRDDFEKSPESFGICLYKTWNGRAIWE